MEKLIKKVNNLDEPCVVVAFGDHKPWLGEENSVYEMLGIDLDVSDLEGFYDYYATPYIIGYDGPAFMKITNSVRKAITAHSDGLFVENGEVVDELSDEDQKMWDQYKKYEYYFMNQKIKE